MCPQITVSAHALVEITKPYKIGLGYEILATIYKDSEKGFFIP